MKFSTLQENLSKALNPVSRIVSAKPTLPILGNVLLEVSAGKVKLAATDLDISINTWVGADAEVEGSVTVSAKTFSEFINSLPKGRLEIELSGNQLRVKSKNNSAAFNIIPSDEFPPISAVEGSPVVSIQAGVLKKAIEQVVFSAALDDARPALTGIQFESAGKNLSLAGVDGYRLSKKVLKLEKSLDKFNPLTPAKTLIELARIIVDEEDELEEEVEIYYLKEKSQIIFRYKEYDLSTRLVDAKFPSYDQIIPKEHKTRAIIKTRDLMDSVKIINIFARSVIGNKCIIDVIPDEGKISIQAALAEVGENQSEIETKAEGDALVVAFSAKYLSDMLNNIDSEFIVFECSGPSMPGVFIPGGGKGNVDESYLHIIMPMRLE